MTNEVRLFPNAPCFVTGDPEAAGFHNLELPDGFRWVKREAVCRHPIVGGMTIAAPCLLARAIGQQRGWGPYLSPSIEGQRVGVQLISGYGTYFFPLPAGLLSGRSAGDFLEIRLSTLGEPAASSAGDPRERMLGIYELRIIDLSADEFPERLEILQQVKVFEPAGGQIAEILGKHYFRESDRILDIGAGFGWTTLLLAGFSGASAWGIDQYDYGHPSRINFKTQLLERFQRHACVLDRISSLATLADHDALARAVSRCTFLSMNAQELLLPDESFDFVFSLNAFEHISHPDRALAEIRRVLRPGGCALLCFSPLYYCDTGSHLPACVGFNRPWAHLLMSRDEIKEAIRRMGGVPNEVDSILDSLNGWRPFQFVEMFEGSGMRILSREICTGFVLDGAEQSPEFAELMKRFPREDLSTISMLWYLRKPFRNCASDLPVRWMSKLSRRALGRRIRSQDTNLV